MTYKIRLSCCNCYHVTDYLVDRGIPHSEAEFECPNCGCRPNEANYQVDAIGMDYAKHEKMDERKE